MRVLGLGCLVRGEKPPFLPKIAPDQELPSLPEPPVLGIPKTVGCRVTRVWAWGGQATGFWALSSSLLFTSPSLCINMLTLAKSFSH